MSQLTVPKAGINPGPVATTRVAENDLGATISRFGDVAAEVGNRLEADRLDRQLKRLNVDLTRDMNELSLRMAQIGDPDQLEQEFGAGVKNLRNAYLKGVTDSGRPRVDEANQEKFGLLFDELQGRHQLSVGRQALAGRFAQREATYLDFRHTATVAASTADPETRDLYFEQGSEQIEALLSAGVIDAAEAQRRKLTLRSGMDEAAALKLLDEDPAGFLEAADVGEFDGLGGPALSRFRATATGRIAAASDKERKAAEVAAKAQEKQITNQLKEMSGIWSLGQRSVDEEAFLARPDVQANPYFAEAMAHRELLLEMPQLDSMSPVELRDAVVSERKRPKAFKYQAERLALLEGKLAAEEKAWATDPIGHARSKGMPVPELPAFDPENPRELAQALLQFKAVSGALVDNGWTRNRAIFDPATTEQLQRIVQDTKDPAAQAQLAGVIVGSIGDRPDALKGLKIAPTFRFAGGLQIAGGSPEIATSLMRGQQVLDAGTVVLPKVAQRLGAASKIVEDLFFAPHGGAALQAEVLAAADARYVDTHGRVDPSGEMDDDAYLQSVHEVMGGSGPWDSEDARGGIQDVMGEHTILPMGVSAGDVEAALSKLGRVVAEQSPIGLLEQHETERLAVDLARISMTGHPPLINGAPLTTYSLSRMNIRAVADGAYEFFYIDQNGRVLVPNTEDGEPYRFRMSHLLKGTAE